MSFKPILLVFALLVVVPFYCSGCETAAVAWLKKSCDCDKIPASDKASYSICLTQAHGIDLSAVGQQKEDNIKLVAKNWCAKGAIFNTYEKCMKDQGIDTKAFDKNVNDNC